MDPRTLIRIQENGNDPDNRKKGRLVPSAVQCDTLQFENNKINRIFKNVG